MKMLKNLKFLLVMIVLSGMRMRVRRYYKKGVSYPYTVSEEYLVELVELKGEEEAARIDNASYELILDTEEEELSWFYECCARVYANPRWYLDNIEFLPTFRVKKGNIYK